MEMPPIIIEALAKQYPDFFGPWVNLFNSGLFFHDTSGELLDSLAVNCLLARFTLLEPTLFRDNTWANAFPFLKVQQ